MDTAILTQNTVLSSHETGQRNHLNSLLPAQNQQTVTACAPGRPVEGLGFNMMAYLHKGVCNEACHDGDKAVTKEDCA